MKIIVCLDDSNGMAFNGRRQSKDAVVAERIKQITKGSTLLCSPKSDKMLSEYDVPHTSSETFLDDAGIEDYCFTEFDLPEIKHVSEFIIFKWNRRYPKNLVFPIDLSEWESINVCEYPGKSHKMITESILRKKIQKNSDSKNCDYNQFFC